MFVTLSFEIVCMICKCMRFVAQLGSAGSLSLNDCADLSSLRERISLACHRHPSDLGVVHGDVKFDAGAGACPVRYRPAINARRYINVIREYRERR